MTKSRKHGLCQAGLACLLFLAAPALQALEKPLAAAALEQSAPSVQQAQQQIDAVAQVLNESVAVLKQQVGRTPFLTQERRQRVERVESLPASNPAELAEKCRRLLETYRIELDFGQNIETYQATLAAGQDERLVDFLRIGQLALYYQTFDGRETGVWSERQGRWLRLPASDNPALKKALNVARKLEPPQLMVLPLFGMAGAEQAPVSLVSASAEGDTALAGKDELLAAIRDNAANLKPFYQLHALDQAAAAEKALLERLADAGHVADLNELRQLLASLQRRLFEQQHVSLFKALVYAPDGVSAERQVLNVGGFSLIAGGLYLARGENGQLIELPRQPEADVLALADAYTGVGVEASAELAVDPSGGQILQLLVQVPTLGERIQQGGAVAYLILALGGLALLISVYRFSLLTVAGGRIRQQMQADTSQGDNPLGKVLAALQDCQLQDEEALYLVAEESLAAEQAKLEQGLAFLKLIAAIAPMLGLLGTVTGMIETFQTIALHGSGDPKLMSGGISEALVTTVAGLVTAIPILLLHSLLSGKSQALATTLEAQVSLALADRLEQRAVKTGVA